MDEFAELLKARLRNVKEDSSTVSGYLDSEQTYSSFLLSIKTMGHEYSVRNGRNPGKKDGIGSLYYKLDTPGVEFFGSPFTLERTILLQCSRGPKYYKKREQRTQDPTPIKRRKSGGTKKLGCEATMRVRCIKYYPHIKVDAASAWKSRREINVKLKEDLKSADPPGGQLRYYVTATKHHSHPRDSVPLVQATSSNCSEDLSHMDDGSTDVTLSNVTQARNTLPAVLQTQETSFKRCPQDGATDVTLSNVTQARNTLPPVPPTQETSFKRCPQDGSTDVTLSNAKNALPPVPQTQETSFKRCPQDGATDVTLSNVTRRVREQCERLVELTYKMADVNQAQRWLQQMTEFNEQVDSKLAAGCKQAFNKSSADSGSKTAIKRVTSRVKQAFNKSTADSGSKTAIKRVTSRVKHNVAVDGRSTGRTKSMPRKTRRVPLNVSQDINESAEGDDVIVDGVYWTQSHACVQT